MDTVFDRWSEGKTDASSIELVVLLDRSSSMNSQMDQACQAAWAIKYGIDGLGGDARCSVISFSTSAEYLYRPNESASNKPRHVRAIGGTRVKDATKEALRVMARSERKKKILISVSDGDWTDREEAVKDVVRMRQAGVTTAAFFLANSSMQRVLGNSDPQHKAEMMERLRNEHEMFVSAESPTAITALGKTLVKRAMRR